MHTGGALEVDHQRSVVREVEGGHDARAVVQRVLETASATPGERDERGANALLRARLQVSDVRLDDVGSVERERLGQQRLARAHRRELRGEVVDVVVDASHGHVDARERLAQTRFVEPSVSHQPQTAEHDAFFREAGRKRGHRSGHTPPDVGVVTTIRDEEPQHARVVEHRRDDGDVG